MTNEQEKLNDLVVKYLNKMELPGILNFEQLLDEPSYEERWIVNGLIAEGRLVALYGPAKTGKSLLALEMAICVANGYEFLGHPTRQCNVLYLDYENQPIQDIQPRIKKMGFSSHELDNVVYLSSPTELPKLDTASGGQHLAAIVDAQKIGLVILDTLSRTIAGEENDNGTWTKFYQHTEILLKKRNVSLLRIGHTGKDQYKKERGGSALQSDVDAMWVISKNKVFSKLSFEAGRMVPPRIEMKFSIEDEPSLHHEYISQPTGGNSELRTEELIRLLDSNGVPENLTNEQTRTQIQSLGFKAQKSITEEVTRRRKTKPSKPIHKPLTDLPESFDDFGSDEHQFPDNGSGHSWGWMTPTSCGMNRHHHKKRALSW
jgi:hypothetical protein